MVSVVISFHSSLSHFDRFCGFNPGSGILGVSMFLEGLADEIGRSVNFVGEDTALDPFRPNGVF